MKLHVNLTFHNETRQLLNGRESILKKVRRAYTLNAVDVNVARHAKSEKRKNAE